MGSGEAEWYKETLVMFGVGHPAPADPLNGFLLVLGLGAPQLPSHVRQGHVCIKYVLCTLFIKGMVHMDGQE